MIHKDYWAICQTKDCPNQASFKCDSCNRKELIEEFEKMIDNIDNCLYGHESALSYKFRVCCSLKRELNKLKEKKE